MGSSYLTPGVLAFQDYFAQEVPRRIRAHNIQSLCIVASAYARVRRGDEALFETRLFLLNGWFCRVYNLRMSQQEFITASSHVLSFVAAAKAKIGDHACANASQLLVTMPCRVA